MNIPSIQSTSIFQNQELNKVNKTDNNLLNFENELESKQVVESPKVSKEDAATLYYNYQYNQTYENVIDILFDTSNHEEENLIIKNNTKIIDAENLLKYKNVDVKIQNYENSLSILV